MPYGLVCWFVPQILEVPINSGTTADVPSKGETLAAKTMVVDGTFDNAAVLGHARDLGNIITRKQNTNTFPTSCCVLPENEDD